MKASIVNALTIDVEDYFQVSALAQHFPRGEWDRVPCRVEGNVERILEILEEREALATFFTLGWIAERYPHLVRRIAEAGHEIASHGYAHERATGQSRECFLADITLAKAVLEDVVGLAVVGYRAPSFSIGADNLWAHDCIAEAGYVYSSSVYPVKHDHYGIPDAPRFPFRLDNGLLEVPVSTTHWMGRNWPAGGGGFFRLLPYAVSRWQIDRVNRADGRAAIFYFHPWELDPEQPRVQDAPAKARFRHYVNLTRTEPRLRRLLDDFEWGRADQVFDVAAD
ncbi:XrtA system polysaccharide deacetylase [Azoarcus sp. KH32C]|uniref:XrtA system polysaccharide deacetylase n=1 Tax=Azoarcus sp. KH32C TaxID=748247 RepID=UPI0002386995|nr:XrtA system polysaccharide deacetylase [Azoarcus sp. KH32C]BAL25905.1 polysaccharide deacetylase [Azoarcus sp. KH32C]